MKRFIKKAGQQGLGALGQVLMLALFIVAFPRFADNPSAWAADYFVSLAVIAPVFMFFGFELRKRTAAGQTPDLGDLNGKRWKGTFLAALLCLVLLPLLSLSSLVGTVSIFVALIVFRIGTAINEQISANYEAEDQFGRSLRSNLLKSGVFILISLPVAYVWTIETGVILGTFGFGLVWFFWDASVARNVLRPPAKAQAKLESDDIASGFGAFLVALTISVPRLVAAQFFGETILNMVGVGQSLNRIGQVMSGALTQTLIAIQKKKLDRKSIEARYTFVAQIVGFVVLLLCLPLWRYLFPYADGEEFLWVVAAVLLFGLLSQINYVFQSIRLIRLGGKSYIWSPVSFLIIFAALCGVMFGLDMLRPETYLFSMVLARAIQIAMNFVALRLER